MGSRRRCPTCGSKQWHKEPSSGLIACSEGHVLQNYRNEAADVAENMGQHTLRKRALKSGRKKGEGGSKANPELYHGARGRLYYFECQQFLLRKQIAVLTRLWALLPEFEVICRDIWALHLSLLPNPPGEEPHRHNQEGDNGNTKFESQERKDTDSEGEGDNGEESEDDQQPDEEGEENDLELAALLQINSDSSSESEDEIDGEPKRQELAKAKAKAKAKGRKQKGRHLYEMPASTIAVLIVACWMMRLPVMCHDITRLIDAYELPYLDPVSRKLLPGDMVMHLTKHNIQALSPFHAPSTMMLHGLASRLSKLMQSSYGVFTPEANGAPILWRVVSQGLCGTPALYMLTKRLAHILTLPLTLHHTLAPGLERLNAHDPLKHRYDNVPPEVSFVSAAIIVLKMVYGLDGRPRLPAGPDDPACALPRIDEYLGLVREMKEADCQRKVELFSSQSSMCAGDLEDTMMNEYVDFCEKALLAESEVDDGEDSVLGRYFALLSRHEGENEAEGRADDRHLRATMASEGSYRPGEGYRMYSSQDMFGIEPRDYEEIIVRGARWVGIKDEFLNGVVETYERRLQRWWELEKRRRRI